MQGEDRVPKFPESYIGDRADEYDTSGWMERNQKRTTQLCVQYLYDEKLDNIGVKDYLEHRPCMILDLGCGSGFSSEILLENEFTVIGVEILTDMISKTLFKKRTLEFSANLNLVQADINNLPFRNNSFHHVISVSAYNFITHGSNSSREKVKIVNNTAKQIYKLLKPNARMVIEFYPKDDEELNLFISSFTNNGFDGFRIKKKPSQKSGQTFLLLKKC